MSKVKRVPENSPESILDVFEAIKRALMRRGLFRQKVPAKTSTQDQKREQMLETVTQKSHDILFKAGTVFPFTLFPDTVTLDREKACIANHFLLKR